VRIKLKDGRVLRGTPIEIVIAMKQSAIFASALDVHGYIDLVVKNALEFENAELEITPREKQESTKIRAEQLVTELLRTKLAVLV
jgi:hypothetical protein